MDASAAFVGEVSARAKQRGQQLEEMFLENDRSSRGTVSYQAFRKILTSIGFWASEDRISEAVGPFMPNDNEMNYVDLLAAGGPAKAAVPTPVEDLVNFASILNQHGLSLEDALGEFDTHHVGRVSAANFLRAFGNSPLIVRLCDAFKMSMNGEVDYVQMKRELAKSPGALPPKSVDVPVVPPRFAELAKAVKDRGISCLDNFIALDRLRKHRVSKAVFLREIGTYGLPGVKAGEFEDLMALFEDDRGEIDYEQFCDVLKGSTPVAAAKSGDQFDIRKTVAFLRETARNRHGQLASQIAALDNTGTGKIASMRFFRGLAAQRITLSPLDTQALTAVFGDDDGNIDYEAFLSAVIPQIQTQVDPADDTMKRLIEFITKRKISMNAELAKLKRDYGERVTVDALFSALRKHGFDMDAKEAKALKTVIERQRVACPVESFCEGMNQFGVAPCAPEPEPEHEPVRVEQHVPPPADLDHVLAALREGERRSNVDLGNEFRARDGLRKGTVAESQFQSIVLSVARLSNSDLDALVQFYTAPARRVNYNALLKDMSGVVVAARAVGPSDETMTTLTRLKSLVEEKKIAMSDMFGRYDGSRNGTIMVPRMRAVLETIGFQMTVAEESLIARDFADTRMPEVVNYRTLCGVLDSIKLTISYLTQAKTTVEHPQLDRELLNILSSLRERIQARRKRVTSGFAGFDPGSVISERDFREALMSFGLSIKESEIQVLLKQYKVDRQRNIQWEQFCTDVEASRVMSA